MHTGFVMALLLVAGLAGATVTPSMGGDRETSNGGPVRPKEHGRTLLKYANEPTEEHCLAAVAALRPLVEKLPKGDLSRIFAESYLNQAVVEGGNGEFAECLDEVQHAADEVRNRRHVLRPGESLKIRRADE